MNVNAAPRATRKMRLVTAGGFSLNGVLRADKWKSIDYLLLRLTLARAGQRKAGSGYALHDVSRAERLQAQQPTKRRPCICAAMATRSGRPEAAVGRRAA
jgi:hypothetical protein